MTSRNLQLGVGNDMQSMKKEFLETRNSVNTMEASVSTMDHSINEKSLSLGLRTSGQRYVVPTREILPTSKITLPSQSSEGSSVDPGYLEFLIESCLKLNKVFLLWN